MKQRKRLTAYFLFAVTTFVIGYALVWGFGKSRPVSLCEIAAAPENYVNRETKIRVWLQRMQGRSIVEEMPAGWIIAVSQCAETDIEGATVIFVDVADVEKVPVSISEKGRESPAHLTEAIISGYLRDDYEGLHCFAPKYTLAQARLKEVLRVQSFSNATQASEWLISDAGK